VIRVIATTADAESAQPVGSGRAGRRVDYASLLRRGRTPPSRQNAGAGAKGEDPGPDEEAPKPPAQSAPDEHWHSPPAPADALADRIGTLSSPIIEAVYLQQQHFLDLSRRIAGEIAAFCGNPSVSQAGTWDVRLPLDPAVLPGTLLLLSLSPMCLLLRFDVDDVNTRQLLLQNCGMLERELISLLDAWGTPREVEINVW
jgi:type III secretion control protein HpaP